MFHRNRSLIVRRIFHGNAEYSSAIVIKLSGQWTIQLEVCCHSPACEKLVRTLLFGKAGDIQDVLVSRESLCSLRWVKVSGQESD